VSTAESIVVSLERAKELRDAGWPQSSKGSVYAWREDVAGWGIAQMYQDENVEWEGHISAPTAEEILRRLPLSIERAKDGNVRVGFLCVRPVATGGWAVIYRRRTGATGRSTKIADVCADTLANAAAAMYVYLAENNLLPST
jgi:hypothetical protein